MVELTEVQEVEEVPEISKKPSGKLRWRDIVKKQVMPTLAVVTEFKLRRTDFER